MGKYNKTDMTKHEAIVLKYGDEYFGKSWTGVDYAKHYYQNGQWFDFMQDYGYAIDDQGEIYIVDNELDNTDQEDQEDNEQF